MLLEDSEMRELRRAARRANVTVAEWVRAALRTARRNAPARDAERKLAAVRAAAQHAFPTTDIAQMLAEIERGYGPPPA